MWSSKFSCWTYFNHQAGQGGDGGDSDSDEGWEEDDSQESDSSFNNGEGPVLDLSKLLAPSENYLEDVEEVRDKGDENEDSIDYFDDHEYDHNGTTVES